MADKKYVEPDDYIPKDIYDKYFQDDEDSDCADPVLTTKTPANQNRCDNATISCIIPIILTTTDSTNHKSAVEYE